MKCYRCGSEEGEKGNLLFVGRLFPLLMLRPPLFGGNYCKDCAGLANVLGVLLAGISIVGMAIASFLLVAR